MTIRVPTRSALADLYGIAPEPHSALSLYHALSGGARPIVPANSVNKWIFVTARFTKFLDNLRLTTDQHNDGMTSQAGIRACLNRYYWEAESETANSGLIGSWGKGTRVRPPRDIDILFLLPSPVYHRFQERSGNKQSQLLQEVRGVLEARYPQTRMRGDGQVVCVPFNHILIEVCPGFRCQDGSIIVCDTPNDGRYMTTTAEVEAAELEASDRQWSGNTRALVRMAKQWQREHNVPLKSFLFERLAIEFLSTWAYADRDVFWYDWMIRDFFAFLCQRTGGKIVMPLTGEVIPLGSDWLLKAQNAYQASQAACHYEEVNSGWLAGTEWQKIFGYEIPDTV